MLNQWCLQKTTQLNCLACVLSFWSNYTALTLSQVICTAEGESLCKVSAEISSDEKLRNSPAAQKQCKAFIFCRGRVKLQKTPKMIRMITPMSGKMSQQSQNGLVSLFQADRLCVSTLELWPLFLTSSSKQQRIWLLYLTFLLIFFQIMLYWWLPLYQFICQNIGKDTKPKLTPDGFATDVSIEILWKAFNREHCIAPDEQFGTCMAAPDSISCLCVNGWMWHVL